MPAGGSKSVARASRPGRAGITPRYDAPSPRSKSIHERRPRSTPGAQLRRPTAQRHWRRHFGLIANHIEQIQPTRAGCRMRSPARRLRERGRGVWGGYLRAFHCERPEPMRVLAWGRSPTVSRSLRPHRQHQSAERMAPADADAAVANFCGHADDLCSSTPTIPGRRTSTWPAEVWRNSSPGSGFRDVDFDASFVTSAVLPAAGRLAAGSCATTSGGSLPPSRRRAPPARGRDRTSSRKRSSA